MTTAIPWFRDDPDAWDAVTLGGVILPGIGAIANFKAGDDWDVQKGPDIEGANLRRKGHNPASWDIVLKLCTRDEFQEWTTLAPSFVPLPAKSKNARAFPIAHPTLATYGVDKCIVKDVSDPGPSEGVIVVTLSCLQWFPFTPATGGAVASATGGSKLGKYNNSIAAAPKTTKPPWTGEVVNGQDPTGARAADAFKNSQAGKAASAYSKLFPPSPTRT